MCLLKGSISALKTFFPDKHLNIINNFKTAKEQIKALNGGKYLV